MVARTMHSIAMQAALYHPDFVPATIDANIWAREFCKRFPSMDEGTMIGWFANAIMAGFDEAQKRAEEIDHARTT